jgi:hypothetical protein
VLLEVGIVRKPRDHHARRRARTFLDRVDDGRRLAVALDARTDVDLEESATQILAANALTIDNDQVRIRRSPQLLDAPQGESIAKVLGLDGLVALELDRLEPLLARVVDRLPPTPCGEQAEDEKSVRERPDVRLDHGYLEGCR